MSFIDVNSIMPLTTSKTFEERRKKKGDREVEGRGEGGEERERKKEK